MCTGMYERAWPRTTVTPGRTEPGNALATGGDPLHLSLDFNIDHTDAMAYAIAARNLLSSPAEQALSRHPE